MNGSCDTWMVSQSRCCLKVHLPDTRHRYRLSKASCLVSPLDLILWPGAPSLLPTQFLILLVAGQGARDTGTWGSVCCAWDTLFTHWGRGSLALSAFSGVTGAEPVDRPHGPHRTAILAASLPARMSFESVFLISMPEEWPILPEPPVLFCHMQVAQNNRKSVENFSTGSKRIWSDLSSGKVTWISWRICQRREGWKAGKSSIKALADLVSDEDMFPDLQTAASLPHISSCGREGSHVSSCLIFICLFIYLAVWGLSCRL